MEHRALGSSSASSVQSQDSGRQHEGRNVWILTGYGISGLVLFMILTYYFSSFITR
jgi:hypothetical protein